ncbi:cysteine dioxygenase [Bacillus salinus]|uniref:cysteine dioxygenase n=1 Tax=Bacillus sp. HMF5848 TaxID=2495421 RepID=UPI0026BA7D75|nr:cysteine dioxygenase family protein [Bacillus sp. HMF5848]
MLNDKVRHMLDSLKKPLKFELKEALLDLNMTMEDLPKLPESKSGKPYSRELLYKNEEVELLVMNWSELECAPHDHGSSQGWIQVLNGATINTVYEITENGLPSELFHEYQEKDNLFYAPKKGVHKMKAARQDELVTLHLYSPPISGMKVYDLDKCAACIVADDCGAWWPDEQRQKVQEIRLKKQEQA